MADDDRIIEQLPDGRVLRFPKGTSPEVIERVKREQAAQAPAATAPAASAQPPARAESAPRPGGAQSGALADSFLGRAARGAIINRIDPAAEMAARLGARVGLASEEDVRQVQGMNAERRDLQADARKRVGSEGFDWAALAGTAPLDFFTLRGLLSGSRALSNPQDLFELSKAGAVAGAVTGVVGPTENSEKRSDAGLLLEKAKQAAMGGVFGGVAAPLVALGLNKAVETGQNLVGGAKRLAQRVIAPNEGQKTVADPRALEAYLQEQAQRNNIDWAKLPETVRASLREATRRAVSVTGELPDAAVRNRLVAEAEGLPPLTLGQATRDPIQFSREANSPEEELRRFLASQRDTATAHLRERGAAFGPQKSPYELGSTIGDDISAQATAKRKAIEELYKDLSGDAAGYHRIANTPDFVRKALATQKTEFHFDNLPPAFQKQLLALEESGGKLSIRDAVQLWKNINSHYSSTVGTPTGAALRSLKEDLRELLDTAKFTNTTKGDVVLDKFRAANQARRQMGEWEETSAAIAELASRKPAIAAERVFSRYIMNGSVKDFIGLWKTLPEETQGLVRRHFVDTVAAAAMNKTDSAATGAAGSAMKMLRDYPKEKLALMFKPEELKSLRNTLEYLRLTSEAPSGSFVNRSNSLVDLKDFLSRTEHFPLIGPWATGPAKRLMEQNASRRAIESGGLTVGPPQATIPAAVRHAERLMPFIAAPRGREAVTGGLELLRQEEPR